MKFLSNGKEIIVDIMNKNENEVDDIEEESYQSNLEKLIKRPGFKFKCLLMDNKNKKEKNI